MLATAKPIKVKLKLNGYDLFLMLYLGLYIALIISHRDIIMKQILSSFSASISELKNNPTALLNEAEGSTITILNHNVPAAYLVPADTYEWLMDKLEDAELAQLVTDRATEKEHAIEVTLDDL